MWKQNYLPFGKQRVGIPNNTSTNATRNQAFGGKSYDGLTGLSYFGARYYDPVTGRFMAVDPVGPDPEGNIHSLNRYTYANNNPYKYVDPDGRLAVMATIAIATIAYSAYQGYQDGGATGAVAEASGYNDGVAAYNSVRAGDYSGAALAVGSVIVKPLKAVKNASDLPIIQRGSKEWSQAVNDLSGLGKGKINVRTATASDAKALLTESRGNMNRYKNYAKDKGHTYSKGYETHNVQNARELGAGNDRQHIKWKDSKSGGHVFYDNPN